MFRRLLHVALAFAVLGVMSAAHAQVEVTLGEEKSLASVPDVDSIDTTGFPGRFRGIRIYALDGSAVDIARIDINYRDGSRFTEDRGRPIRLGRTELKTRTIGPANGQGPEKFIDQIVLHYVTGKAAQGARVRVVGVTSQAGARARRTDEPIARASASSTPESSISRPDVEPAGGDVLFGVQSVGFVNDRDVIRVGSELGKFDKIRLRVLDNDIHINELRVVYSNGEPDILAVGANVAANTRTKWFELEGERFIKEIQLVYRSRPNFRGQARVEVYGEYAEGWFGINPTSSTPGKITYPGEAFKHAPNKGWLYLGGQQPKFISIKQGLGYETDIINVHRNRGFNRVRLDVKDRAITLNKLTVVYADNSDEVISVGKAVDAGSSFTVPTLKAKPIKELRVSYRSRFFDRKATSQSYAFVEFWAQ